MKGNSNLDRAYKLLSIYFFQSALESSITDIIFDLLRQRIVSMANKINQKVSIRFSSLPRPGL